MFTLHCSITVYIFIALHSTTTSTASASHMVQFILSNDMVHNIDYDANQEVWLEKFDGNCESVFIIHGWKNTAFGPGFVKMADAYISIPSGCYNTIRVNWPDAMQDNYANSANAIKKVAEEVATFARKLQKLGLYNSTELVGFSLGAHLAGLVGRTLIQYLGQNEMIKEIIALDPAGPGYTDLFMPYAIDKLQPTDANIVIVLSTNAGCSGSSQRLGTINFIANNGRDQTGCARSDCICSHHKAIDYFIESLTSDRFVGTSGDYGKRAIFGRGLNAATTSGTYYFETNASPPYARG